MIEVEEEFPGLEVLAHCFSAGPHSAVPISSLTVRIGGAQRGRGARDSAVAKLEKSPLDFL
ncbi:unnamed protein product, partial [Nesidiocoris tenuis]